MSAMSDATAKEEVLKQLEQAANRILAALLWPRGMNQDEFHDLKNMFTVLQEIQEDIRAR